MASYYKKYIKDFARIIALLYELAKKDAEFIWSARHNYAFRRLKELLLQEPILALPNGYDPYILAIEFSYEGMGLVLSQVQEGRERVIGYYSKTLGKVEKSYGSMEGECATVIWALERIQSYVMGSRFYILTNHRALLWLL